MALVAASEPKDIYVDDYADPLRALIKRSPLGFVCRDIVERMHSKLVEDDLPASILFFHIRHPFATQAPATGWLVEGGDDETTRAWEDKNVGRLIEEIYKSNRRCGMSGLNHVLDALSLSREFPEYCVALDCNSGGVQDTTQLNGKINPINGTSIPSNAIECFRQWHESMTLDTRDIDIAPLLFDTPVMIQGNHRPVDVLNTMSGPFSDICGELRVKWSPVALRSFVVGVFRTWRYSTALWPEGGCKYLSIRIRDRSAFAPAVAVTCISRQSIGPQVLDTMLTEVRAWQKALKERKTKEGKVSKDASRQWARATSLSLEDSNRRDENADTVSRVIVEKLSEGATMQESEGGGLFRAVSDFIHFSTQFCEEQLEGRPLEYGLVLANPFLFRFWPGARPIPLCFKPSGSSLGTKDPRWYFPDEMAEDVHLTGGLRHRCVVVPYPRGPETLDMCTDPISGSGYPAFSVDLSDLSDGVVGWGPWRLWSSTAAIYAYLSHLYPWAVATMVGPRSDMRVFVGGELIAFRHGKGWRIFDPPDLDTLFDKTEVEGRKLRGSVFEAILAIALQSSTFVRRNQHGGLFLFTEEGRDYHGDSESSDDETARCRPLLSRSPTRMDSLPLLKDRLVTKGLNLNFTAAKLVHSVTQLDGAICFCMTESNGQPELAIRNYAQRVDIRNDKRTTGGTKRAAAAAFVDDLAERDAGRSLKSFAIVVSSDGDVRIVTQETLKKRPWWMNAFVTTAEYRSRRRGVE